MIQTLQVLTILLVSVAMALSLAHALELPGKLRLSEEQYIGMQVIYYPGFTIGGIAEPAGLLCSFVLLIYIQGSGTAFWLTAGSFTALLAMHVAYWLLTHPVNNFWLRDFKLQGPAKRFFAFDPLKRANNENPSDWTVLRDRWEYSHVIRAVLGLISLALLATAITASPN